MFNILKLIPQDGTFDQTRPIKILRDGSLKSRDRFIGSCDMSAATDRLPIKLQKAILSYRFGETFSESWAQLLIGRAYHTLTNEYRYSVGQPMGALSS